MKRTFAMVTVAVLVCLSIVTQPGAANADPPPAYVHSRQGDGEVRATGTHDDSRNMFCAQDRYTDGHSGVVQFKKQSAAGWGTALSVWDHGTADGDPMCVVASYGENTPVVMRACVGEWANDARRRVILKNANGGDWCGTPRSFLT